MVLLRTKGLLEISPPRVDEFLGLGIEAQERHLVWCEFLGADPSRVQGVQALEDLDHARPSLRVRPAVHVPPRPADVRPYSQLKALDQPVIPAAGKDLAQVALERARLDPTEHRDASGANVQG